LLLCSVEIMENQEQEKEIQTTNNVTRKDEVCTLCEEFASQALHYLAENKTQTEILEKLHRSCSRLTTFEQEVTFSFLAGDYWLLNWKKISWPFTSFQHSNIFFLVCQLNNSSMLIYIMHLIIYNSEHPLWWNWLAARSCIH